MHFGFLNKKAWPSNRLTTTNNIHPCILKSEGKGTTSVSRAQPLLVIARVVRSSYKAPARTSVRRNPDMQSAWKAPRKLRYFKDSVHTVEHLIS